MYFLLLYIYFDSFSYLLLCSQTINTIYSHLINYDVIYGLSYAAVDKVTTDNSHNANIYKRFFAGKMKNK